MFAAVLPAQGALTLLVQCLPACVGGLANDTGSDDRLCLRLADQPRVRMQSREYWDCTTRYDTLGSPALDTDGTSFQGTYKALRAKAALKCLDYTAP